MTVSLATLSAQLGAELYRDDRAVEADVSIADVASLEQAGPHDLTYVESDKHLPRLAHCRAAAVLVKQELVAKARGHFAGPLLAVADAQDAFIRAMVAFRPAPERESIGISPRAIVAPSARIGAATNIHPLACIGERVEIGEHCEIHPGAVIGDDCRIGNGVTIYPNAVLYARTEVGHRSIIHAGAVLGADGFGYRFAGGRYVKIPHTGHVKIGEDVEIGAGATIDRGMVGPTVIGNGTKIDNLVMIAHNCEIGQHNAFASQVGFAGSVKTDDYVRCAGQAGVANHLHIGKGSTLGPKAGVHLDVPPGETWHGMPAGPDKDQIRKALCVEKLPDMRRELQSLVRQVAALQALLASDSPSKAAA